VSSTWSSDNAFLFLASAQTIHRYDPSSNSLTDLYNTTDQTPISNIVFKDKGSLIFSAGENVHLLDCGSTPKICQTFDSHKCQITSLSLSNDASLLSSTSAAAAHIYNLALGSHIILRGLPSGGQAITTSAFHTQLRTRLLLGIGKQLVVYDTTRPSGPIKTVALGETSSGDITAVACSPFSKTLVAVATTGGSVGLIDLEKEKGSGVIRTHFVVTDGFYLPDYSAPSTSESRLPRWSFLPKAPLYMQEQNTEKFSFWICGHWINRQKLSSSARQAAASRL
jgi:protein NEDD1